MNLNFKTLVGALAVLSIASCSKNDVFDAQQAAANEIAQKKSTFENNFVAKYGQVAPTQSWDFSTNQQRLGTIFLTMFLISLRTETTIIMCRKLFS